MNRRNFFKAAAAGSAAACFLPELSAAGSTISNSGRTAAPLASLVGPIGDPGHPGPPGPPGLCNCLFAVEDDSPSGPVNTLAGPIGLRGPCGPNCKGFNLNFTGGFQWPA